MISRLLVERRVIDGRPVAAFDLADEGPQLADYLPELTTVATIDDTGDQMAFFERLIADEETANVVDLSHRTFKGFFTVAQKIGFFEEARRRGIEPVVLFIVDPDPRSAKAFSMLRRWLTQALLLPVQNQVAQPAMPPRDAPAKVGGSHAAPELPVLGFSLRALVDRPEFSFVELWRTPAAGLSGALDDELLAWAEQVFVQLRNLEVSLRCEEPPTGAMAASLRSSRRLRQARPPGDKAQRDAEAAAAMQRASDAPKEVLQFAPKHKPRVDSESMDQSGRAIVAMLHEAADRSCGHCDRVRIEADELARQLEAAANRVAQLERELELFQDRAVRAETWLQLIQREVEKLMPSAAAMRPKSTH